MRSCIAAACLLLLAGADANAAEPLDVAGRQIRKIEGWTVLVSNDLLEKDKAATERALELLTAQLQEIARVVPAAAVAELRKVPLWFSPEYPNVKPRAEYHPDAGWLRANNRDPAMEKSIEFTNVRIFEREAKRMPNFALHELAHAYHDRLLPQGFDNVEIKAAFEKAKASGRYERVEQRFGDGRSAEVRAYAITNPQEYFAECSEAFFSTNDFFPFNREELTKHDPEMAELLKKLWGEPGGPRASSGPAAPGPAAPAKPMAKAEAFYTPEQDKAGLASVGPLDKRLPNVLILGDSISIGYTRQVRDGLKGKANVVRPNANCGDTRMGLAGIDKWLGDTHWDVIHFNWGLWDLCYRNPESKNQGHRDKVNGTLSTSLADYENNLEALVLRLKRTGATLIWASSTMVPDGEAGRFAGDEVKYNAAAERVMNKHGVLIDDLHATTKAFPPAMFARPGDVHYTPEGYAKLASQVVAKVSDVLQAVGAESAGDDDDIARRPPPLNFAPGPEYADRARMFQGIPTIERAGNGRLWAAWYGGGTGEDLHNYVMLVTSGDDGKTWSGLKLVIDPDGDGPCRAFDPCLWHDPRGRLWLSWAERHKSTQLWAITTGDSGSENPKWSAPRPIHEGIMMDKPTVLSNNGPWLLPVAAWGKEGSAMVVSSDDAGATWRLLGRANIPNPADRQYDEHQLVERRDGSLWLLVRTKYGIGQSESTDRGKTWSAVEPSAIRHCAARFFIRRLASGKLLLVKHGPIAEKTGRSNLTAFLSDDDGKTWSGGLLLDERKGVSYPDGVQSPEGLLYVIYDYNRGTDKQILMARFTEADILAGKPVSEGVGLRIVVNQATAVRPPKPPRVKNTQVPAKAANLEK